MKGSIWAIATGPEPGRRRWVYRPLMSLMSAVFFSMLLVYSRHASADRCGREAEGYPRRRRVCAAIAVQVLVAILVVVFSI